jgi:predicted metal-binding membrane protein
MTLTPALRRLALTAHVTASVGWLGAVAVFLYLSVTGLTSEDSLMVRADYRVMESITWFVIVPLCLGSVATGVISSLGTPLGLFRHYWVLIKVAMTVPSTFVLIVHMRPIGEITRVAGERTLSSADHGLQIQMFAASAAALLVLLVATAVSVYKPRGLTRYGWRKQQQRAMSQT